MKNKILSIAFMKSLFFTQNEWHQHGVFLHTLRVTYYTIKAKDFKLITAALLHDVGKPFSAFKKDEDDIIYGEYSFTDHEEVSYQIIKNWPFISEYTKNIVRYHYLIRDIKKSKIEKYDRYKNKKAVWESLNDEMHEELKRFLVYDDLGKGKKRR
ncbi:MAG: HD superfamily phosphohydrolase [Sulfurimonas sp.]|jgi:HD superfamily phosphohydrolase